MRGGTGAIAGAIIGGLLMIAGIGLLVEGISCNAALTALPGTTTSLNSLCSTYEYGGLATLVVAGVIMVAIVLTSRRSSSHGRRVGR